MLRKVNLEMTVLDYDRIGGSDPIGKVLLGYNRKKLEKKHWAEMVDNPRRPVIHWHVLQVIQYMLQKTRDFQILSNHSVVFRAGQNVELGLENCVVQRDILYFFNSCWATL